MPSFSLCGVFPLRTLRDVCLGIFIQLLSPSDDAHTRGCGSRRAARCSTRGEIRRNALRSSGRVRVYVDAISYFLKPPLVPAALSSSPPFFSLSRRHTPRLYSSTLVLFPRVYIRPAPPRRYIHAQPKKKALSLFSLFDSKTPAAERERKTVTALFVNLIKGANF